MASLEQLQARLEKVNAAIDAALSGKRYKIGSARVEAFVGVDNLTNKDTVGSVIINQFSKQYFEPGLPRSWVIGVQSQTPL